MGHSHNLSHALFPWWAGYWLLNPFRRFSQNPGKFRPYIKEGMTVLEVGSGMGYFTLALARMAGKNGRIIALDVQQKMLNALKRRAERSGLASRIEARVVPKDSIAPQGLAGKADAVFALFVVHEMPDRKEAFAEFYTTLKKGGLLIFGEPSFVVSETEFEHSLEDARSCGFTVKEDFPAFGKTRGRILVK